MMTSIPSIMNYNILAVWWNYQTAQRARINDSKHESK